MAISKIILNGVTQIDLTSDTVAASNLISPNTAHGADGQAIVGTASGGGNDFIITLSYNSNTETWDPDCTWAELSAAQTAGKNIIVDADDPNNWVTAGGYVIDSTTFFYYIHKLNVLENNNVTTVYITEEDYDFTANGAIKTYTYTYYDTSDANALPSQVLNGQIFYTSTGRAIGTVPTMTLPTSASSTSSGTSKATIGRSTSNQYINIPTGYNSAAAYYTISATPNMTLPTAASSTSSGTSKATITPSTSAQYLNIPTGYNETASYYTISAVTYSTITVSSSNPSGGSNGDVWIKTA